MDPGNVLCGDGKDKEGHGGLTFKVQDTSEALPSAGQDRGQSGRDQAGAP